MTILNNCVLHDPNIKFTNKLTKELYSQRIVKNMKELLSYRERKVLEYAAQGLDNPQIGRRLYISKHTVKAHMASALRKLSATNRTNAVYLAIKNHIIE